MSDSSSNSGDGYSTPSSSTSGRSGGKSKFERDVEAALRKGASECKNLLHWEVKRIADPTGGNTWTDAGIKSPRDILLLMSPGKAKCSCEKKSCRWAWSNNWNHKGMYQTEYVPYGLEQKGIGEVAAGFAAKKMFPLDYGLTSQEFKFLNDRFPEWYFISHNSGTHDHPVAHTSTKLATRRLMEKLERGTVDNPKIYFDLHGNPSANEAFMARNPGIEIHTFVELITPKDYVRQATKWGPEFDARGNRRYNTIHIRDIPRVFADMGHYIDGFISVHTTYYYDAVEIANLLALAPHAKLYSLMHKFDGDHGYINMREQEWVKKPSSFGPVITQTNVKSGETYEHPDNSWWYNHDAWCNADVGFGWTTGMLCDETFVITATYCPPVACNMSTGCVQIKPLMKVLKHTTANAMTQDEISSSSKVVVDLYGAEFKMDIHPRLVPLFGELRTTIIHKPRNVTNWADHVSRAKVRVKSVCSSGVPVRVDAQQLSDLARASFFIDFQDQYGWDKAMFDAAYYRTLQADSLYKKGSGAITSGTLSMLTDMLMSAADAKDWKMAGVKAARAGIQHLNRQKILATN